MATITSLWSDIPTIMGAYWPGLDGKLTDVLRALEVAIYKATQNVMQFSAPNMLQLYHDNLKLILIDLELETTEIQKTLTNLLEIVIIDAFTEYSNPMGQYSLNYVISQILLIVMSGVAAKVKEVYGKESPVFKEKADKVQAIAESFANVIDNTFTFQE